MSLEDDIEYSLKGAAEIAERITKGHASQAEKERLRDYLKALYKLGSEIKIQAD